MVRLVQVAETAAGPVPVVLDANSVTLVPAFLPSELAALGDVLQNREAMARVLAVKQVFPGAVVQGVRRCQRRWTGSKRLSYTGGGLWSGDDHD